MNINDVSCVGFGMANILWYKIKFDFSEQKVLDIIGLIDTVWISILTSIYVYGSSLILKDGTERERFNTDIDKSK